MGEVYFDPPPSPTPVVGPPAEGPVVVIAPHPDDETAGPGGTLRLHVQRGDRVTVVFLTNGLAAVSAAMDDPAAYQAMREEEARKACESLGVDEIEFWRYPDGARAREEDMAVLVPRIRDVLERVQPGVVYFPWQDEVHRDHHVAAVATRRAVMDLENAPRLLGYEIWSACVPTLVVDISDVHVDKVRACELYTSQLEHTEIIRAFTGLNTYRAVFLPKGSQFGEAFIEYRAGEDPTPRS